MREGPCLLSDFENLLKGISKHDLVYALRRLVDERVLRAIIVPGSHLNQILYELRSFHCGDSKGEA